MTVLLEFKEKLRGFYGKYEVYLLPVIKFLLAFAVFWLISHRLGFMERLNKVSILLILALGCSILPSSVTLLAAGALLTLHCYALSMQAGVIMFVLFVMMYLLYFRFAPRHAYNALLAPIAYILGIPYIMPVANGLLQQPVDVIPTICGVVTYYYLKGIMANQANLAAVEDEDTLIVKFQEILKQFAGNREMYLAVGVFASVALIVYVLRKLPIDYSWPIAIVTGMLMQFAGFFAGYMEIGLTNQTVTLAAGCGISAAVLLVIQFFCFNLDYTRTERVQFEDDEYYYYVKAVPKRYVSSRQKKVKKISGNERTARQEREQTSRGEFMSELDEEES